MPNKKAKPKKGLWGLIPVGIIVTLYLARPYLEANHTPAIACAICDNQQDIHPPTSSHDYGAIVSLTIENTGSSATTIVDHNLSLWQVPETMQLPDTLPETPDPNNKIEAPIGSHSSKILQKGVNEAIIYVLRHPQPRGSTIGPRVQDKTYLFGHVTYKLYSILPVTTEFCFQYIPAVKGLPESWAMCPNHVHIKSFR